MKKFLVEKNIIVQILFYIFSVVAIFILKTIPNISNDYFLGISTCLLSFFIGRDLYESLLYFKQKNVRKYALIILIISSMLVSFSLVGNDFFYNKDMGYFETCIQNVLKYFMVSVYTFSLSSTMIYWIEYKYRKENNSEKNIEKNIFLIFLTSGLIYLIAYNPANMFPDTYMQLRQVFGIDPLFDWHPVFHTLILKLFIFFFKTPFIFAFFHIILFSYVMTKWLKKLYLKGLSKQIIYIFSCTFYFNVAYGLLITNIWKDNLYNICLIWCTYLIYEIIDDFQRFDKNYVNYFYFFISTTGIFCCRHNGIIPIICIIILLILLSIKLKNNKKIYVLCFLLFGVVIAKKPIYNILNVIPNEPGVTYTPLVHDIASVIAYNDGSTLSDNVINEMESVLSVDQWKQQYNSTDSDSYTFYYDEFLNNLNKKNMKEMAMTYLIALKDEPLRIIGARLMSSQIMWSTFKREGSGDYLYEKNNTAAIENEFGFTRNENALKELSDCLYDFFENSKILNTIFFRTGIWFCILVISITTIIIYSKSLKVLFVLVPIISNMISLAISMTCQHLRYVWALYIISILFLFAVMTDKNPEEEVHG